MLPDLVEYINGYKIVYKHKDNQIQLTVNDLKLSNRLYDDENQARKAAEFFINDNPGHSERHI